MTTEMYRVHFGHMLYTETFDDYRDVENAMLWFTERRESFDVERSADGESWQAISLPYEYRAPGRTYIDTPGYVPTAGSYNCADCGLVGGH